MEQCSDSNSGNTILSDVNGSSKNGTLGTHPTLHPPEMGIGSTEY